MEPKSYIIIIIALIVGSASGYTISSENFKNHLFLLELQMSEKDDRITDLQENITILKSQIEALRSRCPQTRVRIDMVEFCVSCNKVIVTIRNTGGITADIESIGIRLNQPGENWYIDSSNDASGAIEVGNSFSFEWIEYYAGTPATFLSYSTSYMIRVTTTTGFYYEMVAVSPSR
jgi:hypothetical protein